MRECGVSESRTSSDSWASQHLMSFFQRRQVGRPSIAIFIYAGRSWLPRAIALGAAGTDRAAGTEVLRLAAATFQALALQPPFLEARHLMAFP